MKKSCLLAICLAALFMPGLASAQANIDCWLDAPMYTAEGPFEEYEYLNVFYRNKGDADATGLVVTLSLPAGVALSSGATVTNVGTVAVGTAVTQLDYQFDVNYEVKQNSTLKWEVTCAYSSGSMPLSDTDSAVTKVRPVLKRKFIGEHVGPVSVSPNGNKILFKDDSGMEGTDYNLIEYNIEKDSYVQLTFDGGTCNSHPLYSPDGKKIAWQRENDSACDYASVMVMKSDGTDQSVVMDDGCTTCWMPLAWTSDSKSLIIRNCSKEIWVINMDGTGMRQLTPAGNEYQTYAEVKGDKVMLRGYSGSWTGWESLSIYDVDTGALLHEINAYDEAQMGKFRPPAGKTVLFKDDWDSYGDLYTASLDNSDLKCLSCYDRVKEYQLSDDATTVTLDFDRIIEIKGVWRADAPNGTNYYDGAPAITDPITRTITLPKALDSNASARVPVLVTYKHLHPGDECNSKPAYNKSGDVIVYKRYTDISSEHDYWLMTANGNNKVRITFNDDDDSGESRSVPQIVAGGNVLISSDDGDTHLALIKLDPKAKSILGLAAAKDDDDDDDDGCSIAGSAAPNLITMMILMAPLAAGVGLRRRARK